MKFVANSDLKCNLDHNWCIIGKDMTLKLIFYWQILTYDDMNEYNVIW